MDEFTALAGFGNSWFNIFLTYAIIEGVPGIASGISSSYSVWYAMLDFIFRGQWLTRTDIFALVLLSTGSMLAALS